MHAKLKAFVTTIIVAVVAVAGYISYPFLTLIVGNGFLWNYTQSKMQRDQYNLEKLMKVSDLRKRQRDMLYEIIQTTRKYLEALEKSKQPGGAGFYTEATDLKVLILSRVFTY